jgi:putative ABC transport system permease protein
MTRDGTYWISLLRLSIGRLRSSPGLSLASLLGLTLAIAIITSVPIFVRGINLVLLRSELADQALAAGRPLFALRFYHSSNTDSPLTFASYNRLNQYLTASASTEIGLPIQRVVRSGESVNFDVAAVNSTLYPGAKGTIGQVKIGFASELADHIDVYEGSFPVAADANSAEVPVLVYRDEANLTGIHAGERFLLSSGASVAEGQPKTVTVPVIVAGIWKAKSDRDPYWFDAPSGQTSMFLVPEATYNARVAPLFKDQYLFASWYIIYNSEAIRTDEIPNVLSHTSRMLNQANTVLKDTRLDYSPTDPLVHYQQRTELLTILLYVFSIPVVGLVLYFLNLVSTLLLEQRRGEISLLASRGGSSAQISIIQVIEALILSICAIPVGLILGMGVAEAIGSTQSFLRFVPRSSLPIALTEDSIRFAAIAAVLGLLTQVLPTIGSARTSIVRYKQDFARSLHVPAWQRYFVDILLLAVVAYGYYTLRQRGSLAVFGVGLGTAGQPGGDPLREPILFVAPTLFVIALSLLSLRIFPWAMTALSSLSGASRQVSWQLAFRNLSRAPGRYVGPLLLIILTLSLATFTASIARTLDQNTIDQVRYAVGADLTILEQPDDKALGIDRSNPGSISPTELAQRTAEMGGYLVPVSEQAKVPGVLDVTRVGNYKVSVQLGTGPVNARLMGVDRVDFPRVAFFRRDFAAQPLVGLMNDLARNNSAVLVPVDFAQKLGLQTGDYLPIQITTFTGQKNVDLVVMGTYTYFPTTYPKQPPTLVANLDYIFSSTGEISPHEVWFTTDQTTKTAAIVDGLTKMGIPVATVTDERERLAVPLARPERIGLFGMLSAGFLVSAGLTALGFGLYSIASLRRRTIELGVLRAIGLSARQMIALLLTEQTLIVISGALIGLAVGTAASVAFVPFFRVGATEQSITPPFQVILGWTDVALILLAFAGVLLLTSLGIIYRLSRLRIFEAVKLGETG